MANYFDEIRAIVFAKGTKASKIEKLQSEFRCTVYEANRYYMQLRPLMPTAERPEGRLRFTIGVEIECYNVNKDAVMDALRARGIESISTGYDHRDSKSHYKLGYDGSICGNDGCEVVSPVLKNLKSLKEVCEVINEAGAKVNKSCGLHVHFGAEKFSVKDWSKIIINYSKIEPIIDAFMAPSRRGGRNNYCKSIYEPARRLEDNGADAIEDIIDDCFYSDRYYKVNPCAFARHKTIEFRQHQGTTDFEKISNWVEFLSRFLDWSIKHDEVMSATSIDSLPFLNEKLKTFYNGRRRQFITMDTNEE